jgi:predicted DNA-binding ribbon-helix-helix protein
MNYNELCDIADQMTETAAKMADLASMLRAMVMEGLQEKIDWEALEAQIQAEIDQLEGKG